MSNLSDLISLAINAVFIFATVGFVAQATTEAISNSLQWRGNLLLDGMKQLLNDPSFNGLALAVYTNPGVNPRVDPDVTKQSELNVKPATINSSAFAVALLEVLHAVPSLPRPNDPLPNPRPVDNSVADQAERVRNAIQNAHDVIDGLVSKPAARDELKKLAQDMLVRHGAGRLAMEQAVAAWFEIGMAHVVADFRRRTQLSNCIVAFVIAASLGLEPIPLGGFVQDSKTTNVGLLKTINSQYVIAAFEWTLVALSTLAGAEFWFNILKKVAAPSTPGASVQAPIPAPAGSGTLPSSSPGPGGGVQGPNGGPSGPTPGTPGPAAGGSGAVSPASPAPATSAAVQPPAPPATSPTEPPGPQDSRPASGT